MDAIYNGENSDKLNGSGKSIRVERSLQVIP